MNRNIHPYSEIAHFVNQYTGDDLVLGEPYYEAHRKILQCMQHMDAIIQDLVSRDVDCLLHPHARVRELAKEKL